MIKTPVALITEDHDMMPEMYREDRALGIAETQYKNDKTINDIFHKEMSIGSLLSYYNSQYKSMNLLHNAFMLYRVNELFKDAQKRSKDAKGGSVDVKALKHQANNLFKQLTFTIVQNIKDLNAHALQSSLNVFSSTDLDTDELKRSHIEMIEAKIVEDFPQYQSLDLANCIASLLKLNYVPNQVITQMNKLNKLTTFNKYACFTILEALVAIKFTKSEEFYDKLFDQLKQTSVAINAKLAARAMIIIKSYKEIFPEKDVSKLAAFFVDRFTEALKDHQTPIESEVLLQMIDTTLEVNKLQAAQTHILLNLKYLNECCMRSFSDRADKLRPDYILRILNTFEDESDKRKIMNSVLQAMKEGRFDVRKFNFNDLATFVDQVSLYQRADVQAFYKYVINGIDQEYFNKEHLSLHFNSFIKFFCLFVREGFIHSSQMTQFYYKFIMTLKESLNHINQDQLISLVWSLCVLEEQHIPNPIIARLFQRLYDFKRDTPITKQEKLELYQIHVYAKEKIRKEQWPKEFSEVIPQKVIESCEQEFQGFDKPLYHDLQLDIAKKMLKLRISFQENVKLHKSYRVDFKLLGNDKVIVMKGENQINPKNSQWYGVYGMKQKYLEEKNSGKQLHIIEVEKWLKLPDDQQMLLLYKLANDNERDRGPQQQQQASF